MQPEGFVEQQAAACDQCPYGVANKTHREAGCGLNDVYVSTPGNVQVVASHSVVRPPTQRSVVNTVHLVHLSLDHCLHERTMA